MRQLVLGVGLLIFVAVSVAVRFHFQASTLRLKFGLLSLASAASIFVFGRELWMREKDANLLTLALVLLVAGGILFVLALHASRAARLKLLFEPDKPQFVLQTGIYRYIRHPFYASYFLFWTGCAIATLHPVNLAYAALIVPLLTASALKEERGFEQSPQAAAYRDYRRTAGLFWPKLF